MLLVPNLSVFSIQRVKNAWSATEAYILTILRKRKEEDPDPAMLNEQDVSGHILNRLVSAWASEDRYTLSEQEVVRGLSVGLPSTFNQLSFDSFRTSTPSSSPVTVSDGTIRVHSRR